MARCCAGLSQNSLLFYNNTMALPLMAGYMLLATSEVQEARSFPQRADPMFLVGPPPYALAHLQLGDSGCPLKMLKPPTPIGSCPIAIRLPCKLPAANYAIQCGSAPAACGMLDQQQADQPCLSNYTSHVSLLL